MRLTGRHRRRAASAQRLDEGSGLAIEIHRVTDLGDFRGIDGFAHRPDLRKTVLVPVRPALLMAVLAIVVKLVRRRHRRGMHDPVGAVGGNVPTLGPGHRIPGHEVDGDQLVIVVEHRAHGVLARRIAHLSGEFGNPRIDRFGHAEVQQQTVDGVATDHIKSTTTVTRLFHVVGVGLIVGAAGMCANLQDLADLSALKHLLHFFHRRRVAPAVAHLEQPAGALDRVDDAGGVDGAAARRFLAEHRLAGLQSFDGPVGHQVALGVHQHHMHVRVG
ncbi:hypothetical protein D3C72_899510 [compost metagenome]